VKQVVFACIHNAGRSQMAAAFFNRLVAANQVRASSAGTAPGERVHPEVVLVMTEAGIDLSSSKPRRLTRELARDASLLITMGCGDECPHVPGLLREDWPLEDPRGKPLSRVREIRDDIRRRVEDLLQRQPWSTGPGSGGTPA
jgi:arsenate reductase